MQSTIIFLAVVLVLGYIAFDFYRLRPQSLPKKNPSSVYDGAIQSYLAQQATLASVIKWACENGGLTKFPRIVHYLGKENGGPGWEDTYQNILIEQILTSCYFEKTTDATFHCKIDNSNWRFESHEWRMLAEKKRLINTSINSSIDTLGLPHEDNLFYSNDFYRTVGFYPADAKLVSIEEICCYLTQLRDEVGERCCSSFMATQN